MFHSTFPKLDIITDYILNYEAAARTSVTSQMIRGCPRLKAADIQIFRESNFLWWEPWEENVTSKPMNLRINTFDVLILCS